MRLLCMAADALISIVIPVYNRATLVNRTLNSIAAQTLRPLNIILVDNNSTDNTFAVLTRWKEENETDSFKISVLQERQPGAACARNCGLKAVTTPYVMFFDSDDTMSVGHTQNIHHAIAENPDADIIGWDITMHNIDGSTAKKKCHIKKPLFNHIFHCSLSTVRYIVKTDFIIKVGSWNSTVKGWDDYELGVRLLLSKPIFKHINVCDNVHVLCQQESITGTDFASSPEKWEYALDCCTKSIESYAQKNAILWIEVRRCILAGMYAKEGDKINSQRLLGEVLDRTASTYHHQFFKFITRFISAGGRGVAILTRLFLTPKIK